MIAAGTSLTLSKIDTLVDYIWGHGTKLLNASRRFQLKAGLNTARNNNVDFTPTTDNPKLDRARVSMFDAKQLPEQMLAYSQLDL